MERLVLAIAYYVRTIRCPLATAIYDYVINVRRLDTNVKFAILSMVTFPPVIVFLIFQKFIVSGLYLGGVKG